jgi:peptidoglycan/xylan/chitin deacetylase (PgdA/CDA1 family)
MSTVKNLIWWLWWFLGIGQTGPTGAIVLTPTTTPTPTVRQATFAEINQKFGPCARVNVLMYHHIQDEITAKRLGQTGLTVTPEWFDKQMEYLRDRQYRVIKMEDLVDFVRDSKPLPSKAVLITLDDAYEDNYLYAFPILKKYGFDATIFTPTGLVTVFDYLNWQEIQDMSSSGLIYFANHTWSHHGSAGSPQVLEKEIRLADTQLAEKGYNSSKVFAYPYGKPSTGAESVLAKYGYNLAFTTRHGNIMCAKQKYDLPRIRVGNAPLSKFGL